MKMQQNMQKREEDLEIGVLNLSLEEQFESRLKELNTVLPGIISSFDPQTQTAAVQPSIRRLIKGEGFINLPLCLDVPIIFPGSLNFTLTYPIEPGCGCLLLFSQRCIDAWFEEGGIQNPDTYRLHSLSDAVCIVGLRSRKETISNINPNAIEIRSGKRDSFISLSESGEITLKGSKITIDGSVVMTQGLSVQQKVNAPDFQTTGGVSLQNHKHGGVQSGPSTTTVPLPV